MKPSHITLVSLSVLLAACGNPDSATDAQNNLPENSAAVCFSPDLYQRGNHFMLSPSDDDGLSYLYTMLGSTEFEGKSVLQQQRKIVRKDIDENLLPLNISHFQLDKVHYEVKQSAMMFKRDDIIDVFYYTPAQIQKFNLQPGESFSHQFDVKQSGADGKTYHIDYLWTFVGMEPQNVPAGKFDTCYFKLDVNTTEPGGKTNTSHNQLWLAKGLGVPVKQQQDDHPAAQLVTAHIGTQDFPSKW